ncbi:MAG TPA: hypothetical protein VKQ11_05090 [Candidatus Sulfotelmatobacter sp.]|nr:hypothetical protein [Candidatus Sulfotelmatobacter sp.]
MFRNSVGRGGLAVVLCLSMIFSGCSTDWVREAESIVAALIPAAANLVALVAALEGKTVSASDLQIVQNAGTQAAADLQLVQSLIVAYEKADAAGKPGILNQIQSAIGAAQGNLQELLPALHIKDAATQAKITAVVGILLAEVQSLGAVVQGTGARDQGPGIRGQLSVRAEVRTSLLSAGEFVKSYNATLTAKTGNAELDRVAAGLRIHGKASRFATAGVMK